MYENGRPQAWVRGGHLPPENVEVFLWLQMLSKTSVDGVFMRHFEKCRQLLGAAPGLCWGTSVL